MSLSYLAEAATAVADTLAETFTGSGVSVYRVTDPGYAQLTPPCVAVDAPTVDEWAGYHSGQAIASMSVPVRILPRSSDAGAQLVALTDAALSAIHAADGLQLASAQPAVAGTGQGITSPLPTYLLSVSVTVR